MPDSFSNAPPRRRWITRSVRVNLLIVYGIETATIVISAVLAFLLRFDFRVPAPYFPTIVLASCIWIPVKLTSFKLLGLDRRWARYISLSDLLRLAFSNLIGSCFALIVLLVINSSVPKSVYAIDFLLCVMQGLRVLGRVAHKEDALIGIVDVAMRALV